MQSFTFSEEPQLILVEGKSGDGKSTISDAMTFAAYGKSSIRKTKELPNRLNKNGYTYMSFLTNSGDKIEIERGLEPNFSRLSINGTEHNLPDKRRVDEFIEEELIKIPFNVFSNTISLSINEFKSFVKLSPTDKRQIIDKIFGLDIVNDMNRKMKDETKELKQVLATLDFSINSNSAILQNSIDQLNNMKVDLTSAKKIRMAELEKEISKLNINKETAKTTYNQVNMAVIDLEKAVVKARESRTIAQSNISELQKKLILYDMNKKCPHCLSDLTDTGHVAIKDTLLKEKEIAEKIIPNLDESVRSAQIIVDMKKVELGTARENFYKVDGLLNPLKQEYSTISIDDLDETSGTEYINGVIAGIEKTLHEAEIERTKIIDQLKITQEMEEILSDNGMKRLLMSQIVPILNKKILRTSKILDFPFALEFDLAFEPIITQLGIKISPESLSTGEQKKMNVIVLLGIIELIKLKHHSANLLFLDEIFSSLDVESIYRMVDLLKTFSKKYRMTIFVISHVPLPEELFDKKLSIKKVDHFSDIETS